MKLTELSRSGRRDLAERAQHRCRLDGIDIAVNDSMRRVSLKYIATRGTSIAFVGVASICAVLGCGDPGATGQVDSHPGGETAGSSGASGGANETGAGGASVSVDDGNASEEGDGTGGGATDASVDSEGRASVCGGSTEHIEAAQIHVTRSTNSPEVTVVVYCDGGAERTLGQPGYNNGNVLNVLPKVYDANSPDILIFLHDLDAVGDVSQIPASHAPANLPDACPKSVSFGTVTTVTVLGKSSGDLQCLLVPTVELMALAKDCRVLAPWP